MYEYRATGRTSGKGAHSGRARVERRMGSAAELQRSVLMGILSDGRWRTVEELRRLASKRTVMSNVTAHSRLRELLGAGLVEIDKRSRLTIVRATGSP
jgi:hypothetical protein